MKRYLLLPIISFMAISISAQEINYDFGSKIEVKKIEKQVESPYTMFGDNTAVLQTKHEDEKDHTLKITIKNNDGEEGLFMLDFQTGIVNLINEDEDVIFNRQLNQKELARFTSIDPHAENYYSWSPYAYVGNNPIRIIDPTGMDWYIDNDGSYQYNKDLNKKNQADILKDGQSYLGLTAQVNDSKGNAFANFRSDGSIMFASESGALSRIINNTRKTGNEEAVTILNKGALVMPNYDNDKTTSKWGAYGYTFENDNIVNKNRGESFSVITTAHTHPNGGDMTRDVSFARLSTPQKPVFAIHVGGPTDGKIEYIISSSNKNDFRYTDVTNNSPGATGAALMKGTMSLRGYAQSIIKAHKPNGVFTIY